MAQITVQQAIKQARQLHDAGRFAEAERLYRLALVRQPDSPVALAGLGSLAYIGGRPEIAVDLITRAIVREPDDFTYYNDLAVACCGQWGGCRRPSPPIESPYNCNPIRRSFGITWAAH